MNAPLSYTLEANVAVLRMDDGKANALSSTMIEALVAAIDKAESEANAVVLAGREGKFCAGFDLKVMMAGPAQAKALLKQGSNLLMRLYGCKVPLVIASTGHALAGGALVLLTGDVRIGAEGPYRIGLNEVQIGLPVPVLAMELARDRIDARELANATLMAKIYEPAEAARVGYLDKTLPEGEVFAAALEEAKRLSALPKRAYAATKARLRGKTIAHVESTLDSDMDDLLSAPIG